jgi:hypothetical protein
MNIITILQTKCQGVGHLHAVEDFKVSFYCYITSRASVVSTDISNFLLIFVTKYF